MPAGGSLPRTTRLPLYLALAYVVLISYASLYPLANWRDLGVSPLAFLDAGWPRYWTGFDLSINVLAYLPLGFLLTLALRHIPGGGWTAGIVALLLGSLLSNRATKACKPGCRHACHRTSIWPAMPWAQRSVP